MTVRPLGTRLSIVLLVAVLVLPWHSANRHLPRFDAADFAITAIEIGRAAEAGVIPGIRAAYEHRGWRPILFPLLAMPFFAIADGSLRAGIALTQFAMVLIIAFYVFALARRFLSDGRAFIVMTFIVSLPWLIYFSMVFYAELAWIACAAGWLYHTVASRGFRERRHTILSGVLLALMACVRPVESVLVAIPAMAMFGWLAHRRRELNPGGLLLACGTAVVVVTVWWAPFLDELYAWAYETSFGAMALATDQRLRGVNLWTVVRNVTSDFSPRQLDALVIAAAGLFVWHRGRSRPPAGLVAAGLAMAAPIIAVLSWTGTSSYRRLTVAIFVVFVGLAIAFVHPAWRWRRLRAGLLATIAAAQVTLIVLNGVGVRPAWLEPTYASYCMVAPVASSPDIAESVVRTLEIDGVRSGRVGTFSWCYYDDLTGCTARGLPWFEPAVLTATALAQRSGLRFGSHNSLSVTAPSRLAAEMRDAEFRYVLLDLFEPNQMGTSGLPNLIVTSGLLAIVARDGFIPGLVPIRRYDMGGRIVVLFEVAPDIVTPPALDSVPVTRLRQGNEQ